MSYTPFIDKEVGKASALNSRFDELVTVISSQSSTLDVITAFTTLSVDAPSITINAIPTTYKVLRLVAQLRLAAAVVDVSIVRLNGDTNAANYYSRRVQFGAAVSSVEQLGTGYSGFLGALIPQSSADAGSFAQLDCHIYFADLTSQKGFQYFNVIGDSGGVSAWESFGSYRGTAAITSLSILTELGTNLVAGSAYALYGVK